MAKKVQQRLDDLATLMGHTPETTKVTVDEVTVTSKTLTIEGEIVREPETAADQTTPPADEPETPRKTKSVKMPKAAKLKVKPVEAEPEADAEPEAVATVDENERMRRIMLLRPWVNSTAKVATEAERLATSKAISTTPKVEVELVFDPYLDLLAGDGEAPAAEAEASAPETPAPETPTLPELQPGERRTAGGRIIQPFIPVVEQKPYKDRLAESQPILRLVE